MKLGMGLVTGALGVAAVSAVIYTVMSGAGEEIYRSLTEGPPGVRAPDPEKDQGLLGKDGALGMVAHSDTALGEHLRTSDSLVARRVRDRLEPKEEADPEAVRHAVANLGREMLNVSIEDATGHDLQVMTSVLQYGPEELRLKAARGLAAQNEPGYARAILSATHDAEQPEPLCSTALALIGGLDSATAVTLADTLLRDEALQMDKQCRLNLRDAKVGWAAPAAPEAAGQPQGTSP